jgi:amino-acid N-acetyltransferase
LTIRRTHPDDLGPVTALLSTCALPTDDLAQTCAGNFLVAAAGNKIVGVCGIESFGTDGLLRSLAVAPDFRRQKLGERLVAACESSGREAGVEKLYLLTTTARDYLLRLGYQEVARASVPETIRAHPQFRGLCPASASCLVKNLPETPVSGAPRSRDLLRFQ